MDAVIKISNYRFYIKEFLLIFFCYLFLEPIFGWLFIPVSAIVLPYEKLLSIGIYFFLIYRFNFLKTSEKVYVIIFSALILRMVLESLYQYNTFFQQLTMFSVLVPVMYVIFIKTICRSHNFDLLELLAKFYIFTYIVFMAIYGRGFSFSLAQVEMTDYGPTSGDSRIIHARSLFMMIIPLLWYLHQYISFKKLRHLFVFIFCFVVILIHQHRSVWSSAIIATLIYLVEMFDENNRLNNLKNAAIVFNGVKPRGFGRKSYTYGYGYTSGYQYSNGYIQKQAPKASIGDKK